MSHETTGMSEAQFRALVQCTVCKRVTAFPWESCTGGSVRCAACASKQATCPCCAESNAKRVRCHHLERMARHFEILVPCDNAPACRVHVPVATSAEHARQCAHAWWACPYFEPGAIAMCSWRGTRTLLVDHLSTAHRVTGESVPPGRESLVSLNKIFYQPAATKAVADASVPPATQANNSSNAGLAMLTTNLQRMIPIPQHQGNPTAASLQQLHVAANHALPAKPLLGPSAPLPPGNLRATWSVMRVPMDDADVLVFFVSALVSWTAEAPVQVGFIENFAILLRGDAESPSCRNLSFLLQINGGPAFAHCTHVVQRVHWLQPSSATAPHWFGAIRADAARGEYTAAAHGAAKAFFFLPTQFATGSLCIRVREPPPAKRAAPEPPADEPPAKRVAPEPPADELPANPPPPVEGGEEEEPPARTLMDLTAS
jgi:hypothetical protein